VEEPEDYVSDKEIQRDDIESSTPIPPKAPPVITKLVEVTLMTTKFTDVSPKGSILSFPKLTHVITGIVESFMKPSRINYHRWVISNTPLISLRS